MTRYRFDRTVERHGNVVIGGSPLKLFRLTTGGVAVVERIEQGRTVEPSILVDRLLDAGAIHPVYDASGPHRHTVSDVTVVVPVRGVLGNVPSGAIVVDDASPSPVVGATIRLDTNVGPAGARMAGLAKVTTPLVAFVDSDVVLPDGWLDELLPHFDEPRVGLVAPRSAARRVPACSSVTRSSARLSTSGRRRHASGPGRG